jgi:hypothetical protein
MTVGGRPCSHHGRRHSGLVYAHANGDDIWPLLLNEFETDEARGIAHEVPQVLSELLVAAGLEDETAVLEYCTAKVAQFGGIHSVQGQSRGRHDA